MPLGALVNLCSLDHPTAAPGVFALVPLGQLAFEYARRLEFRGPKALQPHWRFMHRKWFAPACFRFQCFQYPPHYYMCENSCVLPQTQGVAHWGVGFKRQRGGAGHAHTFPHCVMAVPMGRGGAASSAVAVGVVRTPPPSVWDPPTGGTFNSKRGITGHPPASSRSGKADGRRTPTQLITAADAGDPALVRSILATHGPREAGYHAVRQRDGDGGTAIMHACVCGDPAVLLELLAGLDFGIVHEIAFEAAWRAREMDLKLAQRKLMLHEERSISWERQQPVFPPERSVMMERCSAGWDVCMYAVSGGSPACVLLVLDHLCSAGCVGSVADQDAWMDCRADDGRQAAVDVSSSDPYLRSYTLALRLVTEPSTMTHRGLHKEEQYSQYVVLMELLQRDESEGWLTWVHEKEMRGHGWHGWVAVARDLSRQLLRDYMLMDELVYRECCRLVNVIMARFVQPEADSPWFWYKAEDEAQGLTGNIILRASCFAVEGECLLTRPRRMHKLAEEPVYVARSKPGASRELYTGGRVVGQLDYWGELAMRVAWGKRQWDARRERDPGARAWGESMGSDEEVSEVLGGSPLVVVGKKKRCQIITD